MTEHSAELDKLGAALAKAQAAVKGAKKDSANPFFKSSYADLASVWEACREALTANGLSVVQFPGFENGIATVDTVLLHASGQWISGKAGAPIGKQDAQGVGSVITYLRRYALQSVASVAPEDDDGNAAAQKGRGGSSSRPAPQRSAGQGPGVAPAAPTSTGPTAAELSERPAALTPEPMPWDGPFDSTLKWKNRLLTDFQTDELAKLRTFCETKDPEKYALYLRSIDGILKSRDGVVK